MMPSTLSLAKKIKESKTHRTPQQWQTIMANYDASDLSQADFCRQQGIASSTFFKWKRRLLADLPEQEPLFIAMPPAEPQVIQTEPQWQVELELGQGVVLRIRQV